MRVVVDAVGGDLGAAPNAAGAWQAARELGFEVVLCGPEAELRRELETLGVPKGDARVRVLDAPERVGMDEEPASACRDKPRSSIMLAALEVAQGRADALVSAGNSGATMVAALWQIKRLKGVLRPAIACPIPTLKGTTVLIDSGANTDCKPWHLLQFALMGSVYARHVLKIERPSVGLLTIGEEEGKGNELVREALPLLKHSGLRFYGPVEGRDIPAGTAEVVVCDGFVGNICLKLMEGTLGACFDMLKSEIQATFLSRLGGLLMRPAARNLKRRLSYEEYGGAPLLGVNGTVIICHGKSSARAIFNAIRVAGELAGARAPEQIDAHMEDLKSNVEFARALE